MIKAYLDAELKPYSNVYIKQTLFNLTKAGKIFDAGRGWYSTIGEPFPLDTEPLKNIVTEIKAQFPLLQFSCWSTEQIKYYFHHLQAKFVAFIYTEKDFLSSVFNSLSSRYKTYLNPTYQESSKIFVLEHKTVVLRPSITQEPAEENYATIEKILVDFWIENRKLLLTSETEYREVFQNITTQYRINMSKLVRYAGRRKVIIDIEKIVNIPMSL